MGKVKDWAYDDAQQQISKICDAFDEELITRQEAIDAMMKIDHADVYLGDAMDEMIANELLDDTREAVRYA
jgi:hypothetical protein|tara:strand:+ start:294 stop:506 length:213 start_codon:yes stop_codon:yes gene_type:complete